MPTPARYFTVAFLRQCDLPVTPFQTSASTSNERFLSVHCCCFFVLALLVLQRCVQLLLFCASLTCVTAVRSEKYSKEYLVVVLCCFFFVRAHSRYSPGSEKYTQHTTTGHERNNLHKTPTNDCCLYFAAAFSCQPYSCCDPKDIHNIQQ